LNPRILQTNHLWLSIFTFSFRQNEKSKSDCPVGHHEHEIQIDTADVGYLFYQVVDHFFDGIISNQKFSWWYSKLASCCRHLVTVSLDLEGSEVLGLGVDQRVR